MILAKFYMRDIKMEYREIPVDSCDQEIKHMHYKIYADKVLIWEGKGTPEQMYLNFCLTCESAALLIH